jgi:hypothetical protein
MAQHIENITEKNKNKIARLNPMICFLKIYGADINIPTRQKTIWR